MIEKTRNTPGYRQRGFTLVEVLAAGITLFLLAAVAIPVYQNYLDTGRKEAIMNKVNAFGMFENNYRLDYGTYAPGSYAANSGEFVTDSGFEPLIYRIPNDRDGIAFTVEAGSCAGGITDCYKVTASNQEGVQGSVEGGTWTWID